MSEMQTLGLLATYKSGLSSLRNTGQDERFIRHYLQRYTKTFKWVYYFSYQREKLEDFTQDPQILDRVRLLPKRWSIPDWLYAVLIPFAYPQAFQECNVFRVFQALGIIPLLLPVYWRRPALVTFGYRYAQFAEIENKPAGKVWLLRILERLAISRASALLVTTEELYRYVQPRRGMRPTVLIPNGADPDEFAPVEKPTSPATEKKTLLFVGRFERQKNLEALIRAAGSVSKEIPIKLLWVGKGSLEAPLRRLADHEGVELEVRPPVPHRQLPEIMRQADAFTLVSFTEGHPKVLLEAMSAALPCIVSDCDGNRVLVQDEQTGFVCRPESPAQIAGALKRALLNQDTARSIGLAARRWVESRYDLSWLVDQETEILLQLAKGEFHAPGNTKGSRFNRWLGYSIRRRLLDEELTAVASCFSGDVLEIGGSRSPRGHFFRPWWQIRSWKTLNKNAAAQPDLIADAAQIPLDNSSVDGVCCLETLEYIEDPAGALKEMRRLLRKDGLLILSVPFMHRHDHPEDRWRFSAPELRRLIEDAGLQVQEFRAQGGLLAGWAHRIKFSINNGGNRWIRALSGALALVPIQLLMLLDGLTGRWPLFRNYPTGFLVKAVNSGSVIPAKVWVPRKVLFYRPPVRNNEIYFRYQRYAELLSRSGAEIRVAAPPPKHERWTQKLLSFPKRMAGALPDIRWADVIVLSPSPNFFWTLLILRMLRKPVIVEHYVSYVGHQELSPRFPAILDRWSYGLVDHVITHTLQMKDEIQSRHRISSDRVLALYCSIDLNHFSPRSREESQAMRQKLGLGERFVVFYHGMHHTWHGLSYLLEAARLLEDRGDIVFVILPGDELPDRPNIVHIRQEQPFETLPSFLSVADVWCSGFVNDTRGDRTFSSTMIQAMAMGIPVITSPSAEKLRHLRDGGNALFVEPRSGAALARKITECCDNREIARRIGQAGRALVEEQFNLSRENEQVLHIFADAYAQAS